MARYEYDTFFRLTKAFDADAPANANWTEIAYDCESNVTSVKSFDKTGAQLLETRFEYDELGRRNKIKRGFPTALDTTTIHHDQAGRVEKVVDQNGNDVQYFYDEASRLTAVWEKKTAGQAIANAVSYSYDLNLNLTQTNVTELVSLGPSREAGRGDNRQSDWHRQLHPKPRAAPAPAGSDDPDAAADPAAVAAPGTVAAADAESCTHPRCATPAIRAPSPLPRTRVRLTYGVRPRVPPPPPASGTPAVAPAAPRPSAPSTRP